MKSYGHVDNKGIPLDKKLDILFNKKYNGFFIELGANDGLNQSNTAFFEKYRGWKGVLVEPSLIAFEKCVKNRPNSYCFNAACVSDDYTNEYISGDFNGNLMSSIDGKRLNNSSDIKVKATTLEKILNTLNPEKIDLLSLDTEGYELPILKGLNLNKYRPIYLLIEIYNKDYNEIIKYLSDNNYKLLENFSNYNHTDNPNWDGMHNDYLFIDESTKQLKASDICSGEKFQQLCDIYCGISRDLHRNPVISKQTNKHVILETLNDSFDNPSIVFCYSCSLELLMNKIHLFKNNFVLISHNEDVNITEKYFPLADNPKVIRWFAQNLMMNHPKVEIIPIGIANAMWPHGNINHLVNIVNISENIPKENDIFFNFNISTNEKARLQCKSEIEKKGVHFIPQIPYDCYLQTLAKYKFAICPEGNGIDCHRLWEAYYLNVIPIMLKNTFSLHVQKYLPCILLDKWEDFDINYCLQNYDKYLHHLNESKKYLLFDTYVDKIKNVLKMNVVYAFIGPLPNYAIDTVHQLRLFYDGPVFFIINDYENPIVDILKNKYNVEIIRYDSVYHDEFNKVVNSSYNRFYIVDKLKGREKLFIYSFERFFILYNLMKQKNMSNVFFLELDNLVYNDPLFWLTEFSKKEMSFMFDNYDRGASGICFVKLYEFLETFLNECIDYILNANTFVSEMGALYKFYQKNKENIQMLPIHWIDTNLPIETYQNYKNYNTIFDAAGIGIYIGGADPIHTEGVIKKQHKNQWSYIDYTKYQYKWELDCNGRNIPFIYNGSEWIRINNLHIHSKDLASNLSKPLL